MKTIETERLAEAHCRPCGGVCGGSVEKFTIEEAQDQLATFSGWKLSHGGERIRKDWRMKSFLAGIEFFDRVARLAEQEGHHPDLHLENYRHVWIETGTHAINGLSQNDFILAAKIDDLDMK